MQRIDGRKPEQREEILRAMKNLFKGFGIAMPVLAILAVLPAQGQAQTYKEKVLFSFTQSSQGLGPRGGLVRDADGNLYGTTFTGGVYSANCLVTNGYCGTVYKVDKTGKETVLHAFTGGGDGGAPFGSVVLDEDGNIYGTTSGGGDPACICGVVYKIDSTGKLTVLHAFKDGLAQNYFGPASGLVRDAAGNLYGTSWTGGVNTLGSLYEIDASGQYSLVHSFDSWDGQFLYLTPLTLSSDGNLYGVTVYGGSGGSGTVYKMSASGKETVLYSFTGGKDGGFPSGNVALDKDGNVYGSTYEGGSAPGNDGGEGVVFKVSKSGQFNVLYTFPGTEGPGGSYGGGVIVDDSTGNVFGTTIWDGANHKGNVFMIDASGNYTSIYDFTGGADGGGAWAPVIRDGEGNLYGTTVTGGTNGGGVVFELSPQ
jgi:uncharacterized repeat protein (TIGR03803 family)